MLFAANLSGADLSGATKLFGTDLSFAHLRDADLRGAYLSYASLRGADLRGVYLAGADLSYADLTGALNLTKEQLDEACGTDAKLPPGLPSDFALKPCRGPRMFVPPRYSY